MKRQGMLVVLVGFALLTIPFSGRISAADPLEKEKAARSGELFDTVAQLDRVLFEAFNAHDAERLMAFFAEDLEFYHDTGGLANRTKTRESFGKLFTQNSDIRRDLVARSLRVYPIKDYGALELGQHRFCHTEKGKEDCGTFEFAMIWRKTGETWKITRVLSYGH